MIVGTVVGRLWNQREVPRLAEHRLVVVDTGGGHLVVAADLIDVGQGNRVLVALDDAAQSLAGQGVDAAVVSLIGGADHLDDGDAEGAGGRLKVSDSTGQGAGQNPRSAK